MQSVLCTHGLLLLGYCRMHSDSEYKHLFLEKDLVSEIDKLRRRKGSIKADAKRNRSPNRFDQFIKNLEQDRDYWKAEVETLQQVLK